MSSLCQVPRPPFFDQYLNHYSLQHSNDVLGGCEAHQTLASWLWKQLVIPMTLLPQLQLNRFVYSLPEQVSPLRRISPVPPPPPPTTTTTTTTGYWCGHTKMRRACHVTWGKLTIEPSASCLHTTSQHYSSSYCPHMLCPSEHTSTWPYPLCPIRVSTNATRQTQADHIAVWV